MMHGTRVLMIWTVKYEKRITESTNRCRYLVSNVEFKGNSSSVGGMGTLCRPPWHCHQCPQLRMVCRLDNPCDTLSTGLVPFDPSTYRREAVLAKAMRERLQRAIKQDVTGDERKVLTFGGWK